RGLLGGRLLRRRLLSRRRLLAGEAGDHLLDLLHQTGQAALLLRAAGAARRARTRRRTSVRGGLLGQLLIAAGLELVRSVGAGDGLAIDAEVAVGAHGEG